MVGGGGEGGGAGEGLTDAEQEVLDGGRKALASIQVGRQQGWLWLAAGCSGNVFIVVVSCTRFDPQGQFLSLAPKSCIIVVVSIVRPSLLDVDVCPFCAPMSPWRTPCFSQTQPKLKSTLRWHDMIASRRCHSPGILTLIYAGA